MWLVKIKLRKGSLDFLVEQNEWTMRYLLDNQLNTYFAKNLL